MVSHNRSFPTRLDTAQITSIGLAPVLYSVRFSQTPNRPRCANENSNERNWQQSQEFGALIKTALFAILIFTPHYITL